MFCRKCGVSVPNAASFCAKCGEDLQATTPMAAIAEAPRPSALERVREALAGEYDVKEEIGRGGMAIVYRAEEKELGRDVAIKVLPASHTHDANLVERFVNEARTAAKLEHPNIIPIYRVGRQGDVIFFAMRYLGGPSLADLIRQMGKMDPEVIRRILTEAAEGLGYAHARGVIHRDVKPDNIMFKDTGECVMCDFGIAKALSGTQLTGTGMAVGTPLYMSPEQVRAQTLDGRSDQYSLGVVAYQCMTSMVPFDGEDSFAIGYKHITEDPPVPDLPTADHRRLFDVISRMLAKDPADRYETSAALVEALRKGQRRSSRAFDLASAATDPAGMSVIPATRRSGAVPTAAVAAAPTPTTPMPRISVQDHASPVAPRRRNRTAALVGGLVVVLGGAGGGGYYVGTGGEPPAVLANWSGAHSVPLLGDWIVRSRAVPETAPDPVSPMETVMGDSIDTDPVDSGPTDSSTAANGVAAGVDSLPPEPTTGYLIIRDVRDDATVWVDGRFVSRLRHELSAGSHEIRVAAPGAAPYEATVSVAAGDTVVHSVRLAVQPQCDRFGEPGFNAEQICFDVAPRLSHAQPLVSIQGIPSRPAQPAVLNIEVLADGTSGTVRIHSPSDVPEFTIRAVEHARTLRFTPASRNGGPVTGWAQVPMYPARQ